MTEPVSPEAQVLSKELIACRKRGLESIDLDTAKQPRLQLDQLEALARDYCQANDLSVQGRIPQIRALLRAGLAAYRASGEEERATFLQDAFFDPPGQLARSSPLDRLTRAIGESNKRQESKDPKDRPKPTDFDALRPILFPALAQSLIGFVDQAKHGSPAPPPRSTTPQETAAGFGQRLAAFIHQRADDPRPPWLVPAGVITAVLLALSITAVVVLNDKANQQQAHHPLVNSLGSTPTASAIPSIGPPPSGKTYTEQGGHRDGGSGTWDSPYVPYRTGPKVGFMQKVEVYCKVYSPVFGSVKWWYRIASSPWSGNYWSPASTFLNGDPVDGPYPHYDYDPAVPDC